MHGQGQERKRNRRRLRWILYGEVQSQPKVQRGSRLHERRLHGRRLPSAHVQRQRQERTGVRSRLRWPDLSRLPAGPELRRQRRLLDGRVLERRLSDGVVRRRRQEWKRNGCRLRRQLSEVRRRQTLQLRRRLHDGKLPVEHVRRRHVFGRDQERIGDRGRLRRRDVPEVSGGFELQFQHGLHDQRLLPELLLRTEELHDAGALLRIRDGHVR